MGNGDFLLSSQLEEQFVLNIGHAVISPETYVEPSQLSYPAEHFGHHRFRNTMSYKLYISLRRQVITQLPSYFATFHRAAMVEGRKVNCVYRHGGSTED